MGKFQDLFLWDFFFFVFFLGGGGRLRMGGGGHGYNSRYLNLCDIQPNHVLDVGAGSIRKSNSSAITKPPRTPVIPTTPKRPKTLPPQSTPMRPKTLPVLSTPKRRQILPLLSTPKRPQFNQSVKNNTQLFATITTPKPVTRKPTPTEDSGTDTSVQ